MSKLAPFLMINFPNPVIFRETLIEVLKIQPEYIEIQVPFSNPIADGPILWEANQKAIQFDFELFSIIEWINDQKILTKSSTKLILMSYLPRLFHIGLTKVANHLVQFGFSGLLIPDINFGSKEQIILSNFFESSSTNLIPLLAPNTSTDRLLEIRSKLTPGQFVYFVARTGTTGKSTIIDNDFQEYLNHIRDYFSEFEVGIGFGINSPSQVNYLSDQGFVPVIASSIIQKMEHSKQETLNYIRILQNS